MDQKGHQGLELWTPRSHDGHSPNQKPQCLNCSERERKKKQCVTITKESSLSGADDESSFSCELGGILTWVVLKESLRGFL